jgi:DNA (cytosine-5)-methyltransferase 3A
MTLIVASRGRNPENPKSREVGLNTEQMLEPRYDGKTNCLTTVHKDNLVLTQIGYINGKDSQANRIYDGNAKSVCLKGESGGGGAKTGMYKIEKRIRRLTPIEAERLQTVKEGYTDIVSNTQRYRMLGNGWNIDTIVHILSYMK